MSAAAVIDSLEFAQAEQSIAGSVPVASLKRLEDVLFDTEGAVSYEVRGGRNARNRPQLELRITGRLHLQCQRCLGLLNYAVDVTNILLLVPRGTQADDDLEDPEAPDAIEANPELDVAGVIEDEVLLSLPLAPRHPEGACASRIERALGEAAQPQTAFAKLAGLKRPRNTH
jgi:uncharacterized protein